MRNRSNHPLYHLWCDMRYRCANSNYKNFHRWGGRGIKVCDRWLGNEGFANFVSDMGERPAGATLDRINNDSDYYPDNCRWATWHEQMANTSKNNAVVGVSYSKSKQCWRATLIVSGKNVLDVCSKNMETVIAARKKAELRYGI